MDVVHASCTARPPSHSTDGKLRLPHALGEPRAFGPFAKMLFDVIRKPQNLLALIGGRNRYQDRLVKSAADHLHLAAVHQFAQAFEIVRMMRLDPFQQRPGVVQAHARVGMALEHFNERQIASRERLFEYVIEIAGRLVRVNEQNQMEA